MPIPQGITEIDFDGDGTNELLVRARRENFNAHSYDMITVYKMTGEGKFFVVPFFLESGKISDSVRTEFNSVWGCEMINFHIFSKGKKKRIGKVNQIPDLEHPEDKTARTKTQSFKIQHNESASAGTSEWYFIAKEIDFHEAEKCKIIR